MESNRLTPDLSVAGQIFRGDLVRIAQAGFRAVICNRPDGEGVDQSNFAEIEAAAHAAGLEAHDLPVVSGKVSDENAAAFGVARAALPKPLLASCRTGMRSATLWSFDEGARGRPLPEILSTAKAAGYDLSGVVGRIAAVSRSRKASADLFHSVVVIGGGAGGIAVAASLKARKPDLDIALIEPADVHYYQPGWTMVGGGVFSPAVTARTMASLIPTGVRWSPAWLIDGTKPSRMAWLLKERMLPPLYWKAMLKGREWMAKPQRVERAA
ncbi:TIGR01244 family sulfur transferase [Methylobacterium fujisawaense]